MRTPAIAGSWYPNNAADIFKLIDKLHLPDEKLPHPAAVMVPHAGYVYSGAVAARALAQIPADEYDRVIILAPSHHMAMPGIVSPEPAGQVDTPFDPVNFSKELHDKLSALPHCRYTPEAHAPEHAIDIQLPLVKLFFPKCEVGALLVGQWDAVTEYDIKCLTEFAREFRKLLDERTLVLISTDFTHYGLNYGYMPFTDNVSEKLPKLDSDMFDAFCANSNTKWAKELHATGATICGASCMHLLLATLPENAQFKKLEYANSAMKTGDWSGAVGYTTAVINADWKQPLKQLQVPKEAIAPLSKEAGDALVRLAEYSLKVALLGKEKVGDFSLPTSIYNELQRPCGAFVTLNEHGHLRGCIGEIIANRPVINVVYDRAVSAALHDTRFQPVQPEELPYLEVEVSVLSVPRPIADKGDIVLGKDGIILQKDGHSAVFLPQVAPEQGWDLATTLTQLSLKAGLPRDAWKEGASFQTFQAQVFHKHKDFYSV